jgi:protein-S-isoprenylcysteine O-methyltransferase Ste14
MEANTAATPDGTAEASARREAGDRKWPWGVRLLVAVLLLPVWAASILASENSFNSIGIWFGPLMTAFIVAVVIAVWAATARSQR